MKKIIVTTSWDDGHVLDLKVSGLLKKYGLTGTFYISPEDRELPQTKRLSKDQVLELSKNFEIGAHTITHPRLSSITDIEAEFEITSSKKTLENWLGQEVFSFCYPGGDFHEAHKKIVKAAGFKLARTVSRFTTSIGEDYFAIPTTVHAYRHWSDVLPIFRQGGLANFFKYYLNWDELAISLFEKTYKEGGVFHLWGHSWEIEKNHDWERLEKVFRHISNRPNVVYLTNGKML